MQYWYSAQLRQYRLQFIRAFSGFSVKTGRGGPNNTEELIKVPCRYGDPSRVAATIVRGNSENKTLSVPFITCYINSLVMSSSRRQDPFFSQSVQVDERYYDQQQQKYTNEIGNRYRVDRYMPVPYDVTMQVDIWTNNEDIKEQLLEQIMVLYNPSINIQTSNNPIDWTVLTYIEMMENITWSSRTIPIGTENPIDIATIQFKFPIWINPPAKVKKQVLIQEVITNIVQGSISPGAMEWNDYEFLARTVVTPGQAIIRVSNVNSTTYALSLCASNGSPIDQEKLPTVTFATNYPRLFVGMVFIWNTIQITISTTNVVSAIAEIRSYLTDTKLNCVLYNNTTMQFINTAGGDNIFADVVSGSLAALGLESATYQGGNLAWWRLLQFYGTPKPYSQYGTNASQIRLKTVDDLAQTNSDLVGWIEIDPTDQNILYWIAEPESFPSSTLPPINAIIDPTVSGPGINLPDATPGQRYLLTENLPIASQSWGNISISQSNPVAVAAGKWTAGTTEIQLSSPNISISAGQLIVSANVGIPDGSTVLSVNSTTITVINQVDPLNSNITITNDNYAPINFYARGTSNDIITYDSNAWVVDFNSTIDSATQLILNLNSNRLYQWKYGFWAPVVAAEYFPGYWTIAL